VLQSDQLIDLLISDVVLAHINGRKVAEIARASRPALKVLFVTGYAESAASRSDVLDAGMDILSKPFALDALGAKVRELIDRWADLVTRPCCRPPRWPSRMPNSRRTVLSSIRPTLRRLFGEVPAQVIRSSGTK
jgi:DNA-binding response OmpR family regulator